MKKSLYILLTLVLLLSILTGCEHFVPGGGQVDRPPLTPAEGSEDPSSNPEGEEDPTVDEYGFTLFPEGNYLADPMFDTDEFLPDYDVDPSMFEFNSTACSTLCSTEDTIFSFIQDINYENGVDSSNHLLRYTDKATGLTLPLCGKPECTHDNYTCNAWAGEDGAYGLRLYDGKLMWVDDTQVKRMDPDGTNRETVTNLDWIPGRDVNNYDYFIHRGYVYTVGIARWVVKDGEAGFAFRVYAKALEGGESLTILDLSKKGNGGNVGVNCWAVPAGNDLIIMFNWYEDAPEGSDRTFDKYTEIYRWSSKTRKGEQLYSAVNSPWTVDISEGYPRVIPGDGVYFLDNKFEPPAETPEGEEGLGTTQFRLFRLGFDTKDFEAVSFSPVFEGQRGEKLTRDHIIIIGPNFSEEHRVTVYDYNWNLIYQSEPLPEISRDSVIRYGEDGDYFYFCILRKFVNEEDFLLAVSLNGGENITIRR